MIFFMILVCQISSDQNLEETQNKNVFFLKRQSEQPVAEVISLVQEKKKYSSLQKKSHQQRIWSVVVAS
jgi:hypothetical protein